MHALPGSVCCPLPGVCVVFLYMHGRGAGGQKAKVLDKYAWWSVLPDSCRAAGDSTATSVPAASSHATLASAAAAAATLASAATAAATFASTSIPAEPAASKHATAVSAEPAASIHASAIATDDS